LPGIPPQGINDESRKFYTTDVYEGYPGANEGDNTGSAPLPVTYREPDLRVSDLVVPSVAPHSGDTIPVTWTVTNSGTRATRESDWSDRVSLSRDPSLSQDDVQLGSYERTSALVQGAAYTVTLNVTLPD